MKHRLFTSLSLLLLYLLILPACQPKKQNTDNNENRENHERFPLSEWVIEDESDSASFTFLHDTLEIVGITGNFRVTTKYPTPYLCAWTDEKATGSPT